jgi:enoyl-CoA hydratase/carnithine racemase
VPLRTELEALLEAAQSDGTRCIVLTGAKACSARAATFPA